MIKIERDPPPTNTIMDKNRDKELKKLRDVYARGEKPEPKDLWKEKEIKEFLHQSQYGKCCYCERRRDEKGDSDIEHFRPKAKLKEDPKHSGYWWLSYSWDNLLISCKKCNSRKGTSFPLKDENKRAFLEKDDLGKEEPLLINPLTENPENFITYDIPKDDKKPPMIKAIGRCERGKKTVNELTGINDKELLIERAGIFKDYRDFYICFSEAKDNSVIKKTACSAIKRKLKPESQFAGFARFYFHKMGFK